MCLDEVGISRLKLGRTIICHKKNSCICVFIHTDMAELLRRIFLEI